MGAKPLSEVYAGSLSRNWPKLLRTLKNGESRILVYSHSPISMQVIDDHSVVSAWYGKLVHYSLGGTSFFYTKKHALEWLDGHGIGFFPASDDEK